MGKKNRNVYIPEIFVFFAVEDQKFNRYYYYQNHIHQILDLEGVSIWKK